MNLCFVCSELLDGLLIEYDDVKMVYPVHLNPLVVDAANKVFGDCDKIKLIKPLEVVEFHNLLSRSYY